MDCIVRKLAAALLAAALCFFCVPAFSEEFPDSDGFELGEGDDFDDLFSDAEDVGEAVVSDDVDSPTSLSFLTIPLKMSGYLDTEVGAAAINSETDNNSFSVYFDLVNYLYFTTRPDKYMAIKGSLKTTMPDSSEAAAEGQNHYFYLYELYFDYILLDRVYITAGKKATTWGNTRLFSDADDYDGDEDATYTNALYDSRSNISGIIRIPFGFSTFTALAMYRGGATSPTHRDMSFAASAEFVFLATSLNLFARVFPASTSEEMSAYYKDPIVGAEVKRTVFGFDVYAQEIARVVSNKRFRRFWDSDLYKRESFTKFVSTAGFYRLWDSFMPYFGVNVEFQNVYYPNDLYYTTDDQSTEDVDETTLVSHGRGNCTNKIAFDFGMSKLGPERNIKVGVQWNHNITEKKGVLKPGIVFSRVFPHCDWRTGFEWKYNFGDEKADLYDTYGKITLGTYLKITLDY